MTAQNNLVQMEELIPLLTDVISENHQVELTVTGNSMRPMLHDRESRVRLAKPGKLKKGDLPLYQRENGTYVLHRIVAITGETLTCCGDAQWHLETGLREAQVLAVVTDFTWKDRWVSCDAGLYRFYWKFWVLSRPLRHLVFGGFNRIRRMLKK